MLNLSTPRGLPVRVPESPEEDPSPRFHRDDAESIRTYYRDHGYAVVRGLISPGICDTQRRLWDEEVKPFDGFIYRQATAKAEKHVLNENGWVMNPILNLQSVDPERFPRFRRHATESILANPALRDVLAKILGEPPKIVQSMYFEGNSATWEHQDSYYLDSEIVGEMTAAWIAIEDIGAQAGRFFVCPGSHRLKLDEHGVANNIAEHHEVYISSVVRRIVDLDLEIRAPALQKGDVLLWNALTIHGSLNTQDPRRSRSSITCHAIPSSRRFLHHQTLLWDVPTDTLRGVRIFRPKDLRIPRNRLIFQVETRLPALFYWAKKRAVKQVIRWKARPRAAGMGPQSLS
ncbi:MAG TPA: phytanoyl-CoA dioxygenase family protein [Steroidobacteraceae bacterium]|nr:phytanoyl-CoA dioxygenase family protein [Steroidobacteraceae bacterium]